MDQTIADQVRKEDDGGPRFLIERSKQNQWFCTAPSLPTENPPSVAIDEHLRPQSKPSIYAAWNGTFATTTAWRSAGMRCRAWHDGNLRCSRKFLMMANRPITSVLTSIGTLTSRPAAFLVLLAYAALWLFLDRESLNWHGAATLFTWAMTLFIQRAEHRDTQAIHAKLDEMLRTNSSASNITRIDDEEPEEIEKHRNREQQGD